MKQSTCAWATGCERDRQRRSLCRMHYQIAWRSGTHEEYGTERRFCESCGGALPSASRRTRRFCSSRCVNVAIWNAKSPDEQRASFKVWTAADEAKRAAERATRSAVKRYCVECGDLLPQGAQARKTFCSRRCINQRSIRQVRKQRQESYQRYRARKMGQRSTGVQQRDWRRLVQRYNERCAYCARAAPLTVDHVIPLSRGGLHRIGNVLPACRACNSSKRARFLVEWSGRHGLHAA